MSNDDGEPGKKIAPLARTWPELIDKMFGQPVQDLVGVAGGDYLAAVRPLNRQRIGEKVKEKLRKRGVEKPEPLSPKLLVPALDALSDESDETLQEMWANLMANAMDPNKPDISLQRIIVDTLKQFEPIDALVLKQLSDGRRSDEIAKSFDQRETLIELATERLHRLGCLGEPQTVIVGHELRTQYRLTALGTELLWACEPDSADND